MDITKKRVRKILGSKVAQLNDIVADLDQLLTRLDTDYYRVCIFGSARIKPDTEPYQDAYKLAIELSRRGVDIVTGGGPGLMEAANKAAQDAGAEGRSIGLPIELPFESDANSHLDVKFHHKRFSSRLEEFMRLSQAVIVTPGGIGTILELFYAWQLIQVDHITQRPIILMGDMWDELLDYMKKFPLKNQLMSPGDFDCIKVCKTVDDVIALIEPELAQFKKDNAGKSPKSPLK